MSISWFGFAGYPEIKAVGKMLHADTRPGHFVGISLCAEVEVGDWKGLVTLGVGHEKQDDLPSVIKQAKDCVDYQRRKQTLGR